MGQEEQFKQEGNQHYAEGEFAKAVAAYNKALKADPENGVLYSNRAAAFLQLGKEVKAIKDADSAIALKPDWAKGYFRKGAALAQLRRWDEAVESLKKALEIEPKNKEVAMLLRDTNRKREAAHPQKLSTVLLTILRVRGPGWCEHGGLQVHGCSSGTDRSRSRRGAISHDAQPPTQVQRRMGSGSGRLARAQSWASAGTLRTGRRTRTTRRGWRRAPRPRPAPRGAAAAGPGRRARRSASLRA